MNEDGLRLCAELASSYLCDRLNIQKIYRNEGWSPRRWLYKLENNTKLYFTAAGLSYKVANSIITFYDDKIPARQQDAFVSALNQISKCPTRANCRCFMDLSTAGGLFTS